MDGDLFSIDEVDEVLKKQHMENRSEDMMFTLLGDSDPLEYKENALDDVDEDLW